MIYLITGVPGSGKSLYAISTLVKQLMEQKIAGSDGNMLDRRLVVDGVTDLLIPHELMAPRSEALINSPKKSEDEKVFDDGHGLWNWFTWCKPGDILFVDEVQRHWRPRGIGTKPPLDIQMLETHRHLGVDFVIVTQNAMLLDQNVRRLVGRHINVRRVFGGARALLYDWDGCQTDTHRTSGATRTLWSYPKDAFKLYKSAELHTKQKQKIPVWFAFPLVVLALGVFAGPKAYDVMHKSVTGQSLTAKSATPALIGSTTSPVMAPAAGSISPVPSAQAVAQVAQEETVEFQGCALWRGKCTCYNDDGYRVDVEPETCNLETGQHLGPKTGGMMHALNDTPAPHVSYAGDSEVLGFMRSRSTSYRPEYQGTAARIAELAISSN